MKSLVLAVTLLAFTFSGVASAAPCRDTHGKFVTCPSVKPKMCRDAKGKFASCTAAASTTPKS